jgi:uncharacterized membrane protein
MSTKITLIIVTIIILAAFITGALVYNQMPERVASHWNSQGQVDGYSNPFTASFLFPGMMAALTLLFLAIPILDPLKANIQKFRPAYNLVIVSTTAYLAYLYGMTLYHSLVHPINILMGIIPSFSLLEMVLGYVIGKAHPNWFVGIRTPWTLSNPVVWAKTHRLGSKLMYGSAGIALLGLLVPEVAIFFLLVPMMAMSLITIVYSYWIYQKETQKA